MPGLVGPIFSDLDRLDFGGDRAVIATAFYSRSALFKLKIASTRLDLMVRLDLGSCDEWKRGMIDPAALVAFADHQVATGIDVRLFVHPIAHAKVYLGRTGYFVGSANLTVRGFSGAGHELLWLHRGAAGRSEMLTVLDSYVDNFDPITLPRLNDYISEYKGTVKKWRKANADKFKGINEEKVEGKSQKAGRYGDYDAFKTWLDGQPENKAKITLDRANGAGHLSGHIRANFFGLRQWLLFDQEMLNFARAQSVESYNLARGSIEERRLKQFVDNHAADEPGFSLNTWRGYLPIECGGRAANRGGTIGNLHPMLPLVAKYLP